MQSAFGYVEIGGVCVPPKVLAASVPLTGTTAVVVAELTNSLQSVNLNPPVSSVSSEEMLSLNAANSRTLFHREDPPINTSRWTRRDFSYLQTPCSKCWPFAFNRKNYKCGFREMGAEKCKYLPQYQCQHGVFCVLHITHENTCIYKRCNHMIPDVAGEYLCKYHENEQGVL